MCRIAFPHDDIDRAPATGATRLALWALGVGTVAGTAALVTHVAWPPIAALVACCVFLGFVAPRYAWPLGLLAGLVVASIHGAVASAGRFAAEPFGVMGPFGAILPALAGVYLGQMAAGLATRLRGAGEGMAS